MKKTTVYLEPELDVALGRLAAREGVTKAEVIRRALAAAIRDAERPHLRSIGVGAGPGDVTDDVDAHLRETGFGTA